MTGRAALLSVAVLFSSGRSRNIACPGRRRQRHSPGACECARAQRLGQRSQRHRQRGQGAGDPAADDHSGDAARRLPSCGLPRAAGAAGGKDQTNAICDIEIAPRVGASDRQGAGQTARRRDSKHLQGMLKSHKRLDAFKPQGYRRHPANDIDLILRSLRSKRLEGWTQREDSRPSFETRARARSSARTGEAV